MNTSEPTKNDLISYITKNYSAFKIFLKTLHKKKNNNRKSFQICY